MSTDHNRDLSLSAGLIGLLTFASRILGFGRDLLFAYAFGTTKVAEAFVVSFKIPNMLRDLVGEGAMNASIVPVLSEKRAKDGDAAFRSLAITLAGWFCIVLLILSVAGVLLAPLVVRLAAPGFMDDPEKFNHTVQLTRLIFPFIFLVGMSALMMGILNTLKRFAASAAGPIFLNLAMITALVLILTDTQWGIKALAIGVLIGGILQCLVQIPSFRSATHFKGHMRWKDPAVKKVLKLLLPRVWGTAVYQTSVFVDTILASFVNIVGAGGQTTLYFASRLFQLPLAIFGVSYAQATLPTLSEHAARRDFGAFKTVVSFSLRHVIFMTLPACIGLVVLAEPIVTILFKRGAFTDYSATITSNALLYYALGLVSCGFIKILVNAFFALHDTKAPVKTAFIGLVANICFNLMFMWHLKIGGLALATSLAATLNAVLLYRRLVQKLGPLDSKRILKSFLTSFIASLVMGVILQWAWLPWIQMDQGLIFAIAKLLTAMILSMILYYIVCLALKSEEARQLRGFSRKP